MNILFRKIASLAILTLSFAAHTSDWPSWRGEKRDGYVSPGVPVPEKLPAQPKIVWHVPVADGFSSPVVGGGRVVFLDFIDKKETVRSLDAATGEQKWSVPIDTSHTDGFGTGPRCTPILDVAGGKVFAQSTKGELQCLNATDGKMIWHKNYTTDFGQVFIGEKGEASGAQRHGNSGSPLIDGDHLIALVGATGASVVCFNKNTGDVVWKSQDDMTGYGPPVILNLAGTRQIVVFTAIALISLDPADGKLLWREPLKTRLGRHVTTPIAVGPDIVAVASHQVGLVGFKITKEGSAFKAEQLYQNKEAAFNFASPVAVGNFIYGVGNASKIMCIDGTKGTIAWDQTGVITTSMDKAFAAFLVMGKNILVLTDTGELALFAADSSAYKEISRVKVADTNWCVPAYADGKLYIREKISPAPKKDPKAPPVENRQKELICVDLMQ